MTEQNKTQAITPELAEELIEKANDLVDKALADAEWRKSEVEAGLEHYEEHHRYLFNERRDFSGCHDCEDATELAAEIAWGLVPTELFDLFDPYDVSVCWGEENFIAEIYLDSDFRGGLQLGYDPVHAQWVKWYSYGDPFGEAEEFKNQLAKVIRESAARALEEAELAAAEEEEEEA